MVIISLCKQLDGLPCYSYEPFISMPREHEKNPRNKMSCLIIVHYYCYCIGKVFEKEDGSLRRKRCGV